MSEPFLFDDMEETVLEEEEVKVYTSPIEQATLDIMEEVDLFFRSSVTVEEYNAVQKKVKKILKEVFDENSGTASVKHLLIMHPDETD